MGLFDEIVTSVFGFGDNKSKIEKTYTSDDLINMADGYLRADPFCYFRDYNYDYGTIVAIRLVKYDAMQNSATGVNKFYSKGFFIDAFSDNGKKYCISDKNLWFKDAIIINDSPKALCDSLSKYIPRMADAEENFGYYTKKVSPVCLDNNFLNNYVKPDEIKDLSEIKKNALEKICYSWINEATLLKEIGSVNYNVWKDKFVAIKYRLEDIKEEEIKQKRELYRNEKEEKENERILENQEAIEAAGEKGERDVAYALKWLPKDCISLNSIDKKIIIVNKDFSEEPQEFDHIVITPCGIVLIETKAVTGHITIDSDGNWRRNKNGVVEGMQNPLQQVRRHEKVIKSILPEKVKVFSLICIANEKAIIDGTENSVIPVVKSDMIAEYIEQLVKEQETCIDDVEDYKELIGYYLV